MADVEQERTLGHHSRGHSIKKEMQADENYMKTMHGRGCYTKSLSSWEARMQNGACGYL